MSSTFYGSMPSEAGLTPRMEQQIDEIIGSFTGALQYRGERTAAQGINTLLGHEWMGIWRLSSGTAQSLGLGSARGTLIVLPSGGTVGVSALATTQLWEPELGQPLRRTSDGAGNWNPWEQPWFRGSISGDLDPHLTRSGSYLRQGSFFSSAGYPTDGVGTVNIIHSQSTASGPANTASTLAIVSDTETGQQSIWTRSRTSGVSTPWQPVTGAGALGYSSVERTGEWTSPAEQMALLRQWGQHREAEYMEIGTSVQGRPIPAIRIGFATNLDDSKRPTILLTAGVHGGTERGPVEGALRFIRETLEGTHLARMHVSIIVVPCVNPDAHIAGTRSNANNVNLNRDFIDNTQPETQAIRALIERENIIAAADLHNGGSGYRINFIEPTAAWVTPAVFERSQRMFDAVWEHILDNDEEPARYPYPPDHPGLFHEGMASVYNIPSLLMEIPFVQPADRDDRQIPPRGWMAYGTSLLAQAVVDVAWREREAFIAARDGQPYTAPERYQSAIELGRTSVPVRTGWRNVTSSISHAFTSGSVYLAREGSTVHLHVSGLTFAEGTTGFYVLANAFVPAGFRPPRTADFAQPRRVTSDTGGSVRVDSSGRVVIYLVTANVAINAYCSWLTTEAAPTTLPGTPA